MLMVDDYGPYLYIGSCEYLIHTSCCLVFVIFTLTLFEREMGGIYGE